MTTKRPKTPQVDSKRIDVDAWFAALDQFDQPFMPEGRCQPTAPTCTLPLEAPASPSPFDARDARRSG